MPREYDTPAYRKARKELLTGNPACYWCGKPATTADHLIEVDRGGDSSTMVAACGSCNSRRGAAYKAKRDKAIQAKRNNAQTAFFDSTQSTPTPLVSVFGSNQPEPAETDRDHLGLAPINHDWPRLATPELGGSSYGPAVAVWAEKFLQIELMPWQVNALTAQLMYDDNGLVFREALISTARQQGKSVALRALIGWWLTEYAATAGKQSVLSTANMLDRAEAIFNELAFVLRDLFGAKLIQQIGRKSVQMPDGSRWEVRAASPKLHGGSYDLIVVDELWNVSQATVDEALRPSQIARPNPLLSCWSTAGDESSAAMIQYREQCLAEIERGERSQSLFMEWSMPPGADPKDPANWAYANPAMGRTVTVAALQAASKKESFTRAHLNIWQASRGAWDIGAWSDYETAEPMPAGGTLVVDSSVDDARFVGVRGAVANGAIHVRVEFVVDTEDALWAEIDRVMADTKTALALTPTLELHVPTKYARRYVLWGYAELLKFTSLVRTMIVEGKVRHRGERNLTEHVNRAVMKKPCKAQSYRRRHRPGRSN